MKTSLWCLPPFLPILLFFPFWRPQPSSDITFYVKSFLELFFKSWSAADEYCCFSPFWWRLPFSCPEMVSLDIGFWVDHFLSALERRFDILPWFCPCGSAGVPDGSLQIPLPFSVVRRFRKHWASIIAFLLLWWIRLPVPWVWGRSSAGANPAADQACYSPKVDITNASAGIPLSVVRMSSRRLCWHWWCAGVDVLLGLCWAAPPVLWPERAGLTYFFVF